FAFGLLGRGRLGRPRLAGAAFLAALFFLFIFQAAARSFRGFRRLGSLEAAGRFLLGPLFGGFIGGLARFFFDFALFGGGVLGLELFFLTGAALGFLFRQAPGFAVGDARIGQSRSAAGLFLFGQLAQHHTAAGGRGRLDRLGLGGHGLVCRFLGSFGCRLGRGGGPLLLHHHGLGAAMAEALLDGGSFRLLQRQRLGRPFGFVSIAHESLSFRAGGRARKPERRSASRISRSARPPGWTAACITFSRPSAKPNSALVRLSITTQFNSMRCAAAYNLRLPSAAPSKASISTFGGLAPSNARSTLSKPSTSAPDRRAMPRSPSMRVTSAFSARSARSVVAVTCVLAAREKSFFSTALAMAWREASTHRPRPGSLAATSGTTTPSGPATKRNRRCSGKTSPDTMSRRSRASAREPSKESRAPCSVSSILCARAVIRPRPAPR